MYEPTGTERNQQEPAGTWPPTTTRRCHGRATPKARTP
nr:MAG TPA: hypothetical protein [Caudoviricetes sp.]